MKNCKCYGGKEYCDFCDPRKRLISRYPYEKWEIEKAPDWEIKKRLNL